MTLRICRALGSFLRHFENAAAQFGAGRVEFAVQFGGHLLHAVHDGRELVGSLTEHAVRLAGALVVEFGHGFRGLAALVLDGGADRCELAADFGRTGACGLRHDLRDVAGPRSAAASESSSRCVKRDRRSSRSWVRRSMFDTSDRAWRCGQRRNRWRGRCSSRSSGQPRPGAAMVFELRGQGVEVFQRAGCLAGEGRAAVPAWRWFRRCGW
jgi:hypothetical protein